MPMMYAGASVPPDKVRLLLLAYGVDHAYRVMNFEELIRALPLIDREAITLALDQLVQEGLVTRFGGRVCFNRAIPNEIMHDVEGSITPSGTIRAVKQ